MAWVIAFGVEETLLDVAVLDESFGRMFGSGSVRSQWLAQALQLELVGAITGAQVDSTAAQRVALRMVAARAGIRLDPVEAEAVVAAMRSLPPYPEVAAALGHLRAARLAVVAVTNSPREVAEDQITNAGLRPLFHDVICADVVRRGKPAREPYAFVADRFGATLGSVRLVAAHAWDVCGALAAGCRAAFVARPGTAPPLGCEPDIVGSDLGAVVERILCLDGLGTGPAVTASVVGPVRAEGGRG